MSKRVVFIYWVMFKLREKQYIGLPTARVKEVHFMLDKLAEENASVS